MAVDNYARTLATEAMLVAQSKGAQVAQANAEALEAASEEEEEITSEG